MFTAPVVFFGLVIFAGWSILSCLRMKKVFSVCEACAISYGIGMGGVSLWAFFIFLCGLKPSTVLLGAPWVLLFICSLAAKSVYIPELRAVKKERLAGIEKFVILAIALETIYLFVRAALYPMESYDSVAIWGLKGKAIYLAGGIPLGLLKNANYLTAHPDYPLLVPIQEAVFYFISGCLRDAAAKAIFPMYYLALIFVFYFVLKTLFERKQALIFTFILGTVPQIANYATNGYADLVVAFYYSAGFFFIYLWFSERDMKFIPLSALFSAMGAWTKNEGIPLALLNLAVLAAGIFSAELRRDKKIFRDALKGLFFYAAILALFTLPWEAFKAYHGLKGDLATAETFSIPRAIINLKRIPVILYEYQKQLFGFKKWNIVWALILVSFVFNFKKAFSRQAAPIAISLGGCFLIYTAVYILTPKDFVWHISTSASRLFLHIAPVAALWLAVNFKGSDFDR